MRTKKRVGQGVGREEEEAGEGKERGGGRRERTEEGEIDKQMVIQRRERMGGAHKRGTD